MLYYSSNLLFGKHDLHIKSDKPCLNEFLAFTAFIMNIHLLGYFAIFSKDLRVMITIIFESCSSLIVFLVVFYYTILSIAVSSYTASSNDKKLTFEMVTFNTFTQVFGENPSYEEI